MVTGRGGLKAARGRFQGRRQHRADVIAGNRAQVDPVLGLLAPWVAAFGYEPS